MKILIQIAALFAILNGTGAALAQENTATLKPPLTSISGKLSFLEDNDSVRVILTDIYTGDDQSGKTYTEKVIGGRFSFIWDSIRRPLTMQIRFLKDRTKIPDQADALSRNLFIISSGDNIILHYRNDDFYFTGTGGEVLNCQYSLYKSERILTDTPVYSSFVEKNGDINAAFRYKDSVDKVLLQDLAAWKGRIPAGSLDKIRADYIYGSQATKYWWLNLVKKTGSDIGYSFPDLNEIIITDTSLYPEIREYARYVINKFRYDSCTLTGRKFDIGDGYRFLDKTLQGEMKERALTQLLISNLGSDSLTKYTNIALGDIKNNSYRNLITKMTANYLEGLDAPDFIVKDKNGNEYTLADFKGKVLVLDFWFTGCAPCKQMAPRLDSISRIFAGKPVVFLSINVDRKLDVWQKSVAGGEYTFDNSLKVCTEGISHSVVKDYNVRGYPTLVLIDPRGKTMRRAIDPRLDRGDDIIQLIRDKI